MCMPVIGARASGALSTEEIEAILAETRAALESDPLKRFSPVVTSCNCCREEG